MDKFNMQTQNEFIDLTAPLCQRLQLISRAHLLDLPGMMCLELIDNALNPSLPVCHKVLARSFFFTRKLGPWPRNQTQNSTAAQSPMDCRQPKTGFMTIKTFFYRNIFYDKWIQTKNMTKNMITNGQSHESNQKPYQTIENANQTTVKLKIW